MNKKKELKQHIIEHHQHVIEDLKAEIDSYHSQADLDEGDTMDPEDYSHQSEAQHVERSLQVQLKNTKAELSYLEKLHTSESTEIGPGSLIEFNDRYIYVALPIPPFTHAGKQILTISTGAPIYNLLKSRTVGDEVGLGKERLTIKTIQ